MIKQCSKCKFYAELVDEFRCFNKESKCFMLEKCAPENVCDKFEHTIRIKKLEWQTQLHYILAKTRIAKYLILKYRELLRLEVINYTNDGFGGVVTKEIGSFNTIEEAKTAAQKHFNNLILGCIIE